MYKNIARMGLVGFLLLACGISFAAKLDKNFGASGLALTELELGPSDQPRAIIQNDGKIITVVSHFVNGYRDIYIQRLKTNGLADESFNETGNINTEISDEHNVVQAVALDGANNIIVAGYSMGFSREPDDFIFMRLTKDGEIDENFGEEGRLQLMSHTKDKLYNMITDEGGNIYAVGRLDDDGTYRDVIIKLGENGLPDPLFGSDGMLDLEINGSLNMTLIFDQDGYIIIAGDDNKLVRISSSGEVDSDFGDNGVAEGNGTGGSIAMVIDENSGNIYLGAARITVEVVEGKMKSNKTPLVMRFSAGGILDENFTNPGDQALEGTGVLRDISLTPEGTLIISTSNPVMQLIGLDSTGQLDTEFGLRGILSIGLNDAILYINNIVDITNNTITITGIHAKIIGPGAIFTARILETGSGSDFIPDNPILNQTNTGKSGGGGISLLLLAFVFVLRHRRENITRGNIF